MVLVHKTRYCDIHYTKVLRAPVFKHHMKNITPYKIYADNIELFDAFADTVANFSPISVNIVDYWNKSFKTHDTYVWDPVGEAEVEIKDPAFGWKKSENHGFKNETVSYNTYPGIEDDGSKVTRPPDPNIKDDPGMGFPVKTGDGRLLGEGRRSFVQSDNEREDGSCRDNHKRFFINPIIGVQDKLALTYLNNFYSTYYKARQNPTLRQRLLAIAKDKNNNLDPNKFFNNPNALFTEEKTVAAKTFIMKKGTPIGLKYAQKSAFDAELQGPQSYFMMDITTPAPLEYTIKSNVLEDIFEKFVKPLAHPIGFIYDYSAVCKVLGAEDIDHPLINYQYSSKRIEVNCLCQELNGEKKCGGKHQPDPKVIALSKDDIIEVDVPDPADPTKTTKKKFMDGLWSEISEDAWGIEDQYGEVKFNILSDYKESYGLFRGEIHKYKQWIFENDNYLTAWYIQPKVQDVAPKVIITYHRKNYNSLTGWDLVFTLENDLHCDVADNLESSRESIITEEFKVECVSVKSGDFIVDVDPNDPNAQDHESLKPYSKPDTVGTDSQGQPVLRFRGFMTAEKFIQQGGRYEQVGMLHGGKLVGYTMGYDPTK